MAAAPLALPLGQLRTPELADDCRPVCLRFPGAPPESEVYGELPHWHKPHRLTRGPDGVPEGNWVQTDPDKGWFQLLRFYSPLPSFFDKTWRPGELEPVG